MPGRLHAAAQHSQVRGLSLQPATPTGQGRNPSRGGGKKVNLKKPHNSGIQTAATFESRSSIDRNTRGGNARAPNWASPGKWLDNRASPRYYREMDKAQSDSILETLAGECAERPPSMQELTGQAIQKIRYSHQDMVDFIIANPGVKQGTIAAHYGYTEAWVSRILASDAFQELFQARRHEIADPILNASLEERFRSLTIQSVEVLMKKLDQPAVEANVAIRCAELGAKTLGLGGHAAPNVYATGESHLAELANNLLRLQRKTNERTIEGEVVEAKSAQG